MSLKRWTSLIVPGGRWKIWKGQLQIRINSVNVFINTNLQYELQRIWLQSIKIYVTILALKNNVHCLLSNIFTICCDGNFFDECIKHFQLILSNVLGIADHPMYALTGFYVWGLELRWWMVGINKREMLRIWQQKSCNSKSLMLHYKSHNIKSTCGICKVTSDAWHHFLRMWIMLTCHPSIKNVMFLSNALEMNKHANTQWIGSVHKICPLIPAIIHRILTSDTFSKWETAQQSTTPSQDFKELRWSLKLQKIAWST